MTPRKFFLRWARITPSHGIQDGLNSPSILTSLGLVGAHLAQMTCHLRFLITRSYRRVGGMGAVFLAPTRVVASLQMPTMVVNVTWSYKSTAPQSCRGFALTYGTPLWHRPGTAADVARARCLASPYVFVSCTIPTYALVIITPALIKIPQLPYFRCLPEHVNQIEH